MRKITNDELRETLDKHKKWLKKEAGGERADLSDTDFRYANLINADLTSFGLVGMYIIGGDFVDANFIDAYHGGAHLPEVDLRGADLSGADLTGTDLIDADLRGANLSNINLTGAHLIGAHLSCANLSHAILSGANLRYANLCDTILTGANLRGASFIGANIRDAQLRNTDLTDADLRGANLIGVDLRGATVDEAKCDETNLNLQCPEEGSFIAWKKLVDGHIAKLLIPEDAKRLSAASRKCRANKAIVLSIYDKGGMAVEEGVSKHDRGFIYRVGETIYPNKWDEDRWNECSNGIHFFITRKEAEDYR